MIFFARGPKFEVTPLLPADTGERARRSLC